MNNLNIVAQADLHNELTNKYLHEIIKRVDALGGGMENSMIILESLVTGVMLSYHRMGIVDKEGMDRTLMLFENSVRERLAKDGKF